MKLRLTSMEGTTRDVEVDARTKSDVIKFIELGK